MAPTRVLLADDEPLVRGGLRQALATLPDVVIAQECENGRQVIECLDAGGIDLALLDIHMPECSGIEIVRTVGPDRMPPVVFITAYDHYAVQAFELNAVDYILKPFDEERLIESIKRAKRRIAEVGSEGLAARLSDLLKEHQRQWAKRFSVRTNKGFDLIPVETIDRLEAADNYVQVHCANRSCLLAGSMNEVQARLDPNVFARVHRRHIVNISRIESIAPLLNGTYEIRLETGQRIPTGKQYRSAVLEILNGCSRQH